MSLIYVKECQLWEKQSSFNFKKFIIQDFQLFAFLNFYCKSSQNITFDQFWLLNLF